MVTLSRNCSFAAMFDARREEFADKIQGISFPVTVGEVARMAQEEYVYAVTRVHVHEDGLLSEKRHCRHGGCPHCGEMCCAFWWTRAGAVKRRGPCARMHCWPPSLPKHGALWPSLWVMCGILMCCALAATTTT